MAKYELVKSDISAETTLPKTEITLVKDKIVTTTLYEGPDKYQCCITMAFRCTDGIGPDFSKDIISVSDNSQTGDEVDNQRQSEINAFVEKINS